MTLRELVQKTYSHGRDISRVIVFVDDEEALDDYIEWKHAGEEFNSAPLPSFAIYGDANVCTYIRKEWLDAVVCYFVPSSLNEIVVLINRPLFHTDEEAHDESLPGERRKADTHDS